MKFTCESKLPVVPGCLRIVGSLQHFGLSRCTLTHTPTVQGAAIDTRKHETLPIIHMCTYACEVLRTDVMRPSSVQL